MFPPNSPTMQLETMLTLSFPSWRFFLPRRSQPLFVRLLRGFSLRQCSHLVPGHGAPVRYSLSSGFQDIRSFIKAYQRLNYLQKCQQEHQNVSSSNPLLLCYPMTFLHTILKRMKMKSNRISNVVPFLLVMVFHQDCPLLTVFLSIKTSSQSISLTPTDFAQTLRILR